MHRVDDPVVEAWLRQALSTEHGSVVNEPVPRDLLSLLNAIPEPPRQ